MIDIKGLPEIRKFSVFKKISFENAVALPQVFGRFETQLVPLMWVVLKEKGEYARRSKLPAPTMWTVS